MTNYQLNIPDLSESPHQIVPYELGTETYFFEYYWSARHDMAYISIYLFDDDIKTYLCKKIALINMVDISRYIINDRWVGGLFLMSDKSYSDGYNMITISEDFYLLYNDTYVSKHV